MDSTESVAEAQYKIFVDACWTQSILLVLYFITILRILFTVRVKFVLGLSILLQSTCITWIFECWFKY